MFFVSETASIVAVAFVFAEYTHFILEKLYPEIIFPRWMNASIALFVIWSLSLSNCFGVWLSGIFQNILSSVKIISIMMMVLMIFFAGSNSETSARTLSIWPSEIKWVHFIGLGEAMRFAFFAYSGWEGATYVAEEVKNPSKNLPRSLFFGIGSVMLIYLFVNLAYLHQLSPQEIIVSKKQVAAHAMEKSLGLWGAIILAVIIMISTFGNISTQIMVKARTWYAMSRDNLFPSVFKSLHPIHQTPNLSIFLQASWASCLLLYAYNAENAYESLIDLFSFTSAIFNVLTITCVSILRKKIPLTQRDARIHFRVPFYYFTISTVLIIHIWFLAVTFMQRPYSSLMGCLLTLSGLFYYYSTIRKKHKQH